MNEICVISAIFPANAPYFGDFFRSYAAQTRRDFDLVLFNDGVAPAALERWRHFGLETRVVSVPRGKSPAEVRAFMIAWVLGAPYRFVVFADSDDSCTPNRVEDAVAQLAEATFVFHDMNLVDADHELLAPAYWRTRLRHGETIGLSFLREKNALGFGNSAARREALLPVAIPAGLRAADWFYFHTLLHDHAARFTTKSLVNYRQHARNLSGLGPLTVARLHDICEVKRMHYRHLPPGDRALAEVAARHEAFCRKISGDARFAARYVAEWNERGIHDFWWETESPEETPCGSN